MPVEKARMVISGEISFEDVYADSAMYHFV